MSLHKLCLFTMLATVIFVAVGRLNAQIKGFDAPTPNLWPTVFLPVQTKNAKDLGAGKLLVASRGLADPHFAQTVVLLVRYDAEGVVGLILNRRTDLPLSRVLEGITPAKGRSDPIYLGGPVEQSVLALLQSPAKVEGAEHIFGTVYMISTKPLFEQTILARPDPSSFHVYLGAAGWTNDQLRKELELGAWFIFSGGCRNGFQCRSGFLVAANDSENGAKVCRERACGRTSPKSRALENYFATIRSVRGPGR